MSQKHPFYHQYDRMDCGPTCLRMIAKYYKKNYDISYLRDISYQSGDGTTLGGIADAAEKIGFSTLALTIDCDTLSQQLPLPCIAHWSHIIFLRTIFILGLPIGIGHIHWMDSAFYAKKSKA